MDLSLVVSIVALVISAASLVVSIFSSEINRWFSNRWGTQAIAQFRYEQHPRPQRGRISGAFAVMTITNNSDHPLTVRALEWRIRGTGTVLAEQGFLEEFDGWRSDELPKALPTRLSSGMWYQPTDISGYPPWEMRLADDLLSRETWKTDYRKLQLYFVVSADHVFIADMPREFYERLAIWCKELDKHGWYRERGSMPLGPA